MDRGRGVADGKGSYDGLLAKGGQWNGKIKVVESVMDQPLRWQKPRLIFVNSMSDLFHENVADEVIDRIFEVMESAKRHTFQILTKRPQRMRDYVLARLAAKKEYADKFDDCPTEAMRNSPAARLAREAAACLPSNIWIGVSIEDQAAADERIPLLLEVPAAVRWLSMEPLLAPVDLARWLELGGLDTDLGLSNPGIDWVVVGGESGPKARPMHPQWARDLRDQCSLAGVPFLFKQWGEWAPGECVTRSSGVVPTASLSWEWQFSTENLSREGGHVDDEPDLYRIGKRDAGRLLDGVQHDGYPEARA
jgi:protein gp37